MSNDSNIVTLELTQKPVLIPGTDENWENGKLGCDPNSARPASPEVEKQINDSLGLTPVRFNIDTGIYNSFVNIAAREGVVPQVIFRRAFRKFLDLPLME